jgi:hypothetical protein
MSQQIGDPTSERALRIIRALRWLRRASLADDEVEEFAILMMGLDGLKKLLPVPPAKSQGKQRGKGRKPSTSKPGINATLGHFAIQGCGIERVEWKRVWELRNDLFHGDLTENADTRSKIAGAIPHLRLTLGMCSNCHIMLLRT